MQVYKRFFKFFLFLILGSIGLLFLIVLSTYLYYAILVNKDLSDLELTLKPNIPTSCQASEQYKPSSLPYPEKLTEIMDIFENNYSLYLARHLSTLSSPKKPIPRHIIGLVSQIEIKRRYSYAERRELFFNIVYLGHKKGCSIHGFTAGSAFYFKKKLNALSPKQLLFLVTLVRGPSYYNPYRNPEKVFKRMSSMIDILCDEKNITETICAFKKIEHLQLQPLL